MPVHFRAANAADLPALMALLADDDLGRGREGSDPAPYRAAFATIDADPNQILCVADRDGEIVGMQQITFIPGLSRKGAWRGMIEAVRVARHRRNEGIGGRMIEWAIAECRSRGCSLVQLTSDRTREEAHRFYDRLGFTASHVGYKMTL